MNRKIVFYFLGWVLRVEALSMLLPMAVAFIYREAEGIYFLPVGLAGLVIAELMAHKRPKNPSFYTREGFVSVALSWILMSLVAAIPFTASGCIPSYIDSVFEMISGFTTTGASILSDVEALPRCMLFYRSFTHWIGGMGVLMFVLAILPGSGGNNMLIVRAESPGPTAGKFVQKTNSSAKILYEIYLAITVLEIAALCISGMPLFDSMCLSFGSVGTGGFGILNDSCGSYTSVQHIIITVFMFACGVNFNAYFLLISGKFKEALRSEEVRAYFGIVIACIAAVAINIRGLFANAAETLKNAAFQVVSVITTTGYTTVDFDRWPAFSKCILVMLMFIGACAGSTGGGLKVSRIVIAWKTVRKEMSTLIHPRAVKVLKFEDKAIEHNTLRSVNTYIMCYVLVFTISIIIVSLDRVDFEKNIIPIKA